MADLCHPLGIPVIERISAAVKLAESLVALKLRTSQYGKLIHPLPKEMKGELEKLSLYPN